MLKRLALSVLFFAGFLIHAQERTVQKLADEFLKSVTTAFPVSDSLFITLEEYHLLINRQPMSNSDKSEFKMYVNNSHQSELEQFVKNLEELQEVYVYQMNEGASLLLDTVIIEEVEGTRNIYNCTIRLSIHYPEEDEVIKIFFEANLGTVRRRFCFISPLTEGY